MYIQRTKEKKKTFHGSKKPALTIRTVFLDGKINECVNTCNKQVNKSAGHQQCMRTGRKFSPMIVNVRQWVTLFNQTPHNYADENILTNNLESARHLHILLFLFVSIEKKKFLSSGVNATTSLQAHYMAFTTIQNCILKIRSAALMSAPHNKQHWTHGRGSGASIQFCLLLSLPHIKMARFSFNI